MVALHTFDIVDREPEMSRATGDFVDYTYDPIGQSKTALGKEPGAGPSATHLRL